MISTKIKMLTVTFLLGFFLVSCSTYDKDKDSCHYVNGICFTSDYKNITKGTGIDITTRLTENINPHFPSMDKLPKYHLTDKNE
ncbi:hypothetical protein KJJ67_004541 [Salmonella enterica]|nr:hypothetical protein [Salmonella enterica]